MPGSERSSKQKLPVAEVPGNESSGSERSRERIGQGPTGTFAPGSKLAWGKAVIRQHRILDVFAFSNFNS